MTMKATKGERELTTMKRTLIAIALALGTTITVLSTPARSGPFEDLLGDRMDKQHEEVTERLDAMEKTLQAIETNQGSGATLMVQGRWYGWEHVRAFDSADFCENVRRWVRTDPGRVNALFEYGRAASIADRATKCVLAGNE